MAYVKLRYCVHFNVLPLLTVNLGTAGRTGSESSASDPSFSASAKRSAWQTVESRRG